MIDTRARCECCGATEGGCVKDKVNCRCETDRDFYLPSTLICVCKKCPIHCVCQSCDCGDVKLFGHDKDCFVYQTSKAQIRVEKAKDELESAEMRLKSVRKSRLENQG